MSRAARLRTTQPKPYEAAERKRRAGQPNESSRRRPTPTGEARRAVRRTFAQRLSRRWAGRPTPCRSIIGCVTNEGAHRSVRMPAFGNKQRPGAAATNACPEHRNEGLQRNVRCRSSHTRRTDGQRSPALTAEAEVVAEASTGSHTSATTNHVALSRPREGDRPAKLGEQPRAWPAQTHAQPPRARVGRSQQGHSR